MNFIYAGQTTHVEALLFKHMNISFSDLYESMRKCKSGVVWKDSVASFVLRGAERILSLLNNLRHRKYKPARPRHFSIQSPKPREIASISFRDRVYQRYLNDKYVYPIMTKSFIYDNYACQKNKGTDAARNRLKEFLSDYYRRYGLNGYVARFDIRGYYPNMRHDLVEDMFRRKLPKDIYDAVIEILHNQYPGDNGYNPGSQLVQIAGISFLDDFDHYVKEVLRAHYYMRYMDDFVIICDDKARLQQYFIEIEKYISRKSMTLNQGKSRITPLEHGIDFLGFDYRLTNTGKVLMIIKSSTIHRERKKLARMAKLFHSGKIALSDIENSYQTWKSFVSKGNNHRLIERMDHYYNGLLKNNSE